MISDILPANHKIQIHIYKSKKLLSSLGIEHKKIDVCQENCMLLWKEHKNETSGILFGQEAGIFIHLRNRRAVQSVILLGLFFHLALNY